MLLFRLCFMFLLQLRVILRSSPHVIKANRDFREKTGKISPQFSIETKLKFPAGGANSIKLPLCALPDNKVVVVNLTAGMQFKWLDLHCTKLLRWPLSLSPKPISRNSLFLLCIANKNLVEYLDFLRFIQIPVGTLEFVLFYKLERRHRFMNNSR